MTRSAGSCDASIVVSLYRSERHLDRFLGRVQRFVDEVVSAADLVVELVFVFNAPSALERLAGRRLHDFECRYVRVRSVDVDRETLYASWNRGLSLTTGEVLGFWNVDDCRFSPAVGEAVAAMRSGSKLMRFPYVVDHRWRRCVFVPRRRRSLVPALEFDPDVFGPRYVPESLSVDPFFMFSRSLYEAVGPFDEQFRSAGDLDWSLRASRYTSFTPGSQVAGVYLNEHQGLSVSGSARAVAEIAAIYERHGLTDLVQPVAGSHSEEYDVRRIRVGSTWRTIPRLPPSGARHVRQSAGGAEPGFASALQALEGAASLADLAASGDLDDRLARLAAESARRCLAAVSREELEARLCRGDLRHARREFLRVRPAYLSPAKFAFAAPVVIASPRLFAAYLRRVRAPHAGPSAAGGRR